MSNDPVKNFYVLGYTDQKSGRKRKRAVVNNFRLAYYDGWFDALLNKENRYANV